MRLALPLVAFTLAAQAPHTPPLYRPTPDERQRIEVNLAAIDRHVVLVGPMV
jgi:hypothetical protein